ncbi:hypothetical protein ONE63_001408 [Megalurothrips usitatus]|uniref:MD-2-related lipid-recognition domain-containing protein n=1 Tax=Megalurothrips usitatus TaxID=439358 RepID=A0AAV7XC41_9NEOP|nr:hypothetical protein ONE63_001408 [Megalurothrips usitatus]
MRYSHFNPARPSEFQFMTGNVTIGPHGLDDTMWARVVVDSRSNNQWKENAFVFNFIRKACSQFRDNAPGAFAVFFNATDKKTACPVMTGTYGVVNAKVQWTYPNVPILPYGDYRVRLTYGKSDQTFTCLVSECAVIPKTA